MNKQLFAGRADGSLNDGYLVEAAFGEGGPSV
jgi:hypothetical protein